MLPELIFGIALIAAIFFAFQIMTGNKRRARLADREILEEKDWLEQYAGEFPGLTHRDIIAGLRFASDGFNFEATVLRPDDSWGNELAPTTTRRGLDPAIKDWEALAVAKGMPSEAMGSLTLKDFILHYGPRPEAQTFVEGNEVF